MTESQRKQLVLALIAKGYNFVDANNAANGPRNEDLYKEYCSNPVDVFFAQHLNQGINQDGAYGNQCMDLMHEYIADVLGLDRKVLGARDARTVFTNFINLTGHDNFTRVYNRWWLVPKKGDIMFWGMNPSGHVAIFDKGSIWSFTSYDQNWPVQGYYDKSGNFIGTGVCHFQKHNWTNVLGWLHPNSL